MSIVKASTGYVKLDQECKIAEYGHFLPLKVKYLPHAVASISPPNFGDVGFDIYSAEEKIIYSKSSSLIKTGVCIQLPSNFAFIIKDRSSKSEFYSVLAGVIDSSYTGELLIRVIAHNTPYKIKTGEKIAQGIIIQNFSTQFEIKTVEELENTERNTKGFGSTGA